MPGLGVLCFKPEKFAKPVGICLCSLCRRFPSGWGVPAWDGDPPQPQNGFVGDTAAGGGWQWMGTRQMSMQPEPATARGRGSAMGRVPGRIPQPPGLPQDTQPTHHPPPSLCPPLPRPHPVAISQEPLVPPSPLYRSPPSSPLFSILIILIALFASLSRRSNPSACAQADTQTFISSLPSARLAFFAPAFGGGKEKLAFLPRPVGQAPPPSLASQGHFILPG